MRYFELKEIRRHGDDMLPVCEYEINPMSGLRYLSCHWHKEMELFKLEKGRMKLRCGDSFFLAEEGSLMFINSGELHAAEPVDNDEIIYRALVFSPEFLCGSDPSCSKYINGIAKKNILLPSLLNYNSDITGFFNTAYNQMALKPFGFELNVKAALLNIFFTTLSSCEILKEPQPGGSAAKNIKEVLKYIHENYKKPLTSRGLSEQCNMSEGHFYRLFKEYTLKTPVQYLNNLRISKAMELLASTDYKIIDIAMETGFNGVSYFTDVFKGSTGLTPAKFRKKNSTAEYPLQHEEVR